MSTKAAPECKARASCDSYLPVNPGGDAGYASRGGWMSDRECTSMIYHKQFGQVARHTATPEMLVAA